MDYFYVQDFWFADLKSKPEMPLYFSVINFVKNSEYKIARQE